MIGFQRDDRKRLFYSFNLEGRVPQNRLLRGINQHLDPSNLHQHLSDYYSHTGRPSVDPELMARMLIIGYSFGIRSERRLCEEVHLNLAYRWFCRLGLEWKMPCRITPHSPGTGMAGFATAAFSGICLKPYCSAA